MNPVTVAEGFWNLALSKVGFSVERIELEAKNKLGICNGCYIFDKATNVCDKSKGGCGCYMPAKVRTSESCPIGKF